MGVFDFFELSSEAVTACRLISSGTLTIYFGLVSECCGGSGCAVLERFQMIFRGGVQSFEDISYVIWKLGCEEFFVHGDVINFRFNADGESFS